ncbi:hypothetical protein [Micromonospora craniellae]|uniref:Uncharacterized protein n=1 Tax=Micromonospora craniellae TaxID=2294034 RepID=A0A372FVY4_9ACTN|nr:hypothetical protein [Micromonospora craniellae]QOC93873.1 hypothetical protein ID554_09735 [Micromonospora craniellae]RFS44947.1 hypothetical protein D0Q02_19505 [Micromonospora craniellae]
MVTHLPLITRPMAELCADGRTVFLPGGAMAVGTDAMPTADDPFVRRADAAARFSGPVATPLFPQADSDLLRRMLDRQSAEQLDLMPVHWPDSAGPASLPGLTQWADDLRLSTQVLRTQLDGATGGAVPFGPHRVVDLDAEGRITAAGTGVTVRVVPSDHRASKPWAEAPAEVLDILSGKPYLSGRIVFSADGVEVGLPAELTNHRYRAALRTHGLRFGGSGDDALAATGAERVDEPTGYVDLAYRMDQAGAGAHAVVVVDGPDGESIHLAVNDEARNLSLLGPDGSALLPAAESGRIRLALYPGEPVSVEERLIQIAAASTGSSAAVSTGPSWADTTRNEVALHTWQAADGTGRVMEIIGPAAAVSTHDLGVLAEAAEYLDQPIIVLATDRPGRRPTPEQVSLLNRRLFVHLGESVLAGGHDPVPVVYTRASASPELTRVLDEYGAPLVYEAPGLSAPGADGMPLLNLGSAWTARRPGGSPGGGGQAAPPVVDALSVDLIEAATGLRRAPAFTPPTVPIVSFLSAPLTDPQAILSGLDRAGPALPDQHSQLREAVDRVPSLAGHHAVLSLAKPLLLGGLAGGPGGAAGTGGPAAQVGAMAPMLADLAGVSFDDRASHAILAAIGDLVEGTRSADEVTTAIWEFKDDLPRGGAVRPNWIRKINALVPLVSEGHRDPLDRIKEAIMTCPDPGT